MDPLTFLFLLFAFVALAAAVLVLIARNPVHSVLFMLLTFINVAGMFVLLQAEFIAVIQVLVYSGAILVLFLFVVMLLQRAERPLPVLIQPLQKPVALFAGLAFIAEVAVVMATSVVNAGRQGPDTPEQIAKVGGNIEAIGRILYTKWLLPFEVASVLLLVAAVGALYLAKEDL